MLGVFWYNTGTFTLLTIKLRSKRKLAALLKIYLM